MALNVWNKESGYSFGEYSERQSCNIPLPVTLDSGVTYSVISGSLPPGMRIQGNYIVGTPFEVLNSTEFKFCIRASKGFDISDRTYKLTINNTNTLTILTPEGDLPLGPNGQLFVIGGSSVNFQFEATNFLSNQEFHYYITSDDGELPDKLMLSPSGQLTGYIEPALSIAEDYGDGSYDSDLYDSIAYDISITPFDGFDSYLYDSVYYGFNLPSKVPSQLNRDYGFILSVSDSHNIPVTRRFNIFVVGEEYFRADNTTIPSSTERFTSDCTYLRHLDWSTASELGTYRADNYTTVLLDTYKKENVIYDLALVNAEVTVQSVTVFPLNFITMLTGITDLIVKPDVIIANQIECFDTTNLSKNMPIAFNAAGRLIYALHTISESNYIIIKNYGETLTNLDDFTTGMTVRFSSTTASNPSLFSTSGLEYNKTYFITHISKGETTYTSSLVSSLNFVVFVNNTTDLIVGMTVVVTSGIGEFYPNTTVISIVPNTSFIVSQAPISSLDDAEIIGLLFGITVSETYNGTDVQLSDSNEHMLAHANSTIGGIISQEYNTTEKIIVYRPYYVLDVIDSNHFVISETINGLPMTLTASSGMLGILSLDNQKHSRSLTIVTNSSAKLDGLYITFNGYIANASSTIYQIIESTLISKNTYRLILDIPLQINVPNDVYFYIGSLSSIPDGMLLDRNTSDLYGVIPYQPAITETYKFTINAYYLEYSKYEFVQSPKTFTMNVIGEIDRVITWNTPSDLGTLDANYVSTLCLSASTTNIDSKVRYELTDGKLPFGLTLMIDGEIVGKANQYGDKIIYRSFWKLGVNYNINDVVRYENTLYKRITVHSGIELDFNTEHWKLYTPEKSGITSFSDGTILNQTFDNGRTSFDQVYTFTVKASDYTKLSAVLRTFTININLPNLFTYSNIKVKPLLKINQRENWNKFIYDPDIFVSKSIYRPSDPNFGIQTTLSMLIYAGIETTEAAKYVSAMGLNHKRKRFQFGSVKKAVAVIPGTKTQVYEVIYVEMIDPSESNGKHLPSRLSNLGQQSRTLTVDSSNSIWTGGFKRNIPLLNDDKQKQQTMSIPAPDARRPEPVLTIDSTGYLVSNSNVNTYFPNSITNWRERIKNVGASERNYLPLWMRSIQPDTTQELNFTLAVPLCYCKLGTADEILLNIKHSNFDLKLLDYTADRYIIDAVDNYDGDKYLVFKNDRITI